MRGALPAFAALTRDITGLAGDFRACLLLSLTLHCLLLWLPTSRGPGARSGVAVATLATLATPTTLEARLLPPLMPAVSRGTIPDTDDDLVPASSPAPLPAAAGVQSETAGDMTPQPGSGISSRYYENSELDQRANPLQLAPLIYPVDAYMRRLPGVVSLRVFISETGSIDSVDVIEAQPPGMFEKAAVDAVLSTRFEPARLFGHPVKNVKTVKINFDPFRDHPVEAGE